MQQEAAAETRHVQGWLADVYAAIVALVQNHEADDHRLEEEAEDALEHNTVELLGVFCPQKGFEADTADILLEIDIYLLLVECHFVIDIFLCFDDLV